MKKRRDVWMYFSCDEMIRQMIGAVQIGDIDFFLVNIDRLMEQLLV
jgi:hypothetical protein